MQLPEPKSLAYKSLLHNIECGTIKIPQFQRDYVWNKEKAAGLIDSIVKGYPVGTLITWKTRERLRIIKNLGGVSFPEPQAGDFVEYVLDGQQRLTSLYCALKGVEITKQNRVEDFKEIYIDLTANESEQIVTTDISELEENQYISLTRLISSSSYELVKYGSKVGFTEDQFEKIDAYGKSIEAYNFSVIEVKDASLDVATEIFTRINVEGKALTLFEIMVAKTFDAEQHFDLAEKFEELHTQLCEVDYGTIPSNVILQALALVIEKECSRKKILQIKKQRVIDEWSKVVDAVKTAVDYLRAYYQIPVSAILPYNTLLVPLTYFFYHHPTPPLDQKKELLRDFFWRASLSERYSQSVDSRLGQDVRRIDLILAGKQPSYDWELYITPEAIEERGYFNAGRSFIKAILCLLASQRPKSFADGSAVTISNDWLKQANSKNYHHFFPKSFLRKQTNNQTEGNHIANITIVDDFLNKRVIRAKAPSVYMTEFKNNNSDITEHMKTHFIEIDNYGIWDDDYDVFKQERCIAFSNALKKKLFNPNNTTNQQDVA